MKDKMNTIHKNVPLNREDKNGNGKKHILH